MLAFGAGDSGSNPLGATIHFTAGASFPAHGPGGGVLTGSENENIKQGVKEAYDAIAPFFARHREDVWPPTRSFLEEVSPCSLLDIGCGTGRALIKAASLGCRVTGTDLSGEQITISRKTIEEAGLMDRIELGAGDMTSLPFRDRQFDACIMIASLHHLPSREERVRALSEAFRVVRDCGRMQVSVWSREQERFRELHRTRTSGERELAPEDGPSEGDFYVPWKDGVEVMRFYHLYGPGELEDEVQDSRWTVQRSYFDGRNHWVEAIR